MTSDLSLSSPVPGRCCVIHPVVVAQDHSAGKSDISIVRDPKAQLDEAVSLTAAIQLNVSTAEIVRVVRVSPSHLLGMGAREHIKTILDQDHPELVVINHSLSPVQQRNLEKEWGVKVIDRTGLILEIFGQRAQSAEGKIQVELAALQYGRSRLVRSWTHLERQRGGTGGTGGPGETQLEIDRRLIDDKIAHLKRDLEDVRKRRGLEARAREKVPFPIVAIVGYTNAGKSTLFNRMTGASVRAEDLLFATLDTTMRRLELPHGGIVILSDTVGFISDLPTSLVAAFRATLEQLTLADVILHVRDVSAPDFDAQRADVHAVMHDLGIEAVSDPRVIEVWNKCDSLDEEGQARLARAMRESDGRIVGTSAMTGAGIEDLLAAIEKLMSRAYERHVLTIPAADGKAIAWVHAHAHVMGVENKDDQMVMEVDISPANFARFKSR